jgi:hypothetical protein
MTALQACCSVRFIQLQLTGWADIFFGNYTGTTVINNVRLALIALSIVLIVTSFWFFARFTVDDAFITWRYGRNLVDFGIWNYNPSLTDLTQAYTNPIYALLSIIPAYFKIDVVLFFKLFSVTMLVAFFTYFYSKTKSLLMTLMAYAVPATFIHAFSGLETFLFVTLLVALFISMDEDKPVSSVVFTIMLILTRPEAWLLSLMVPLFFLIRHQVGGYRDVKELLLSPKKLFLISAYKKIYKKPLVILMILVVIMAAYFTIHKMLFGFALPNTFYIKAGNHFSLKLLIFTIITVTPLLLLQQSKRLALIVLFSGFFVIVGFQYTTSSLQMNYAERFWFHILMPIYFILVYVASKNDSIIPIVSDKLQRLNLTLNTSQYINTVAFGLLFLMTITTVLGNPSHRVSDYPRALDSHTEFGKTLNTLKADNKVDSFSFGDAGMASYHSQLNALDTIGLGSALLAHNGLNESLLDLYSPTIVAFYARPDEIRIAEYNQKVIKKWTDQKGYIYVCDIYMYPSYTFKIYAVKSYPEIIKVCGSSKAKNDIENGEYLRRILTKSPFSYWHG